MDLSLATTEELCTELASRFSATAFAGIREVKNETDTEEFVFKFHGSFNNQVGLVNRLKVKTDNEIMSDEDICDE